MTKMVLLPPGTGLPFIEHYLANLVFKVNCLFSTKQPLLKQFIQEGESIIALINSLSPTDGAKRVLIDKVFGIEDNSRYWSAFMVLEHLVIVNTGITSIINTLTEGKPFSGIVRIEEVKPHETAGPVQLDQFKQTIKNYVTMLNSIENLKTHLSHPHPWFGQLNAHDWHCLAATHHFIHRRQLVKIVEKLDLQ